MSAVITRLLSAEDMSEKVRDQIAAVLAVETANQYKLALAANLPDSADYNITVFCENSAPWNVTGGISPFPCLNVTLKSSEQIAGGCTSGIQHMKGTYVIDVFGCGNVAGKESDKESAYQAWKAARIVRNILASSAYTYLGMRSTGGTQGVNKRSITRLEAGVPNGINTGAVQVIVCRMTLEAEFYEESPQAAGVEFDGMDLVCTDKDGHVYFKS